MRYEDIKDFEQRCEEHPDHQSGMISESMIQARLSEEIDELRAYIESKQEQGEPVEHTAVFKCPNCAYPHRVVTHITGAPVPPWEATTPQQRKPLTDEQLMIALLGVDHETKRLPSGFRAFARAIEAAHDIKE